MCVDQKFFAGRSKSSERANGPLLLILLWSRLLKVPLMNTSLWTKPFSRYHLNECHRPQRAAHHTGSHLISCTSSG